jgi:ABC-type glycerol-3-phosphate transport system substrate-binding protein
MTNLTADRCPVQAVFIPGHVWLDSLIQAGLVVPLPLDQVDREILSAYRSDDLLPSVRHECTRNGELYLIPWFSDGHVVFYDSGLGELEGEPSEGVAVLRPSQMAEFAGKLHQPPHRYGLALKADVSEMFLDWLPFLWDFGGELFDDNLNPTFDSREGVTSLEEYLALKRFCPPEVHRFGNAEIGRLLKEGKVGLATTWGGQAGAIFGDAVERETEIPYRAGIYPHPWNATWGIGVPARQPASLQVQTTQFLLSITDEKMDEQILKIAGSPVRVSTYSVQNFRKYFWLKAQSEMLKRCRTLPFTPHLSKILGVMYPAVYAAFVGEKSASQALQEASWQIRQCLREG